MIVEGEDTARFRPVRFQQFVGNCGPHRLRENDLDNFHGRGFDGGENSMVRVPVSDGAGWIVRGESAERRQSTLCRPECECGLRNHHAGSLSQLSQRLPRRQLGRGLLSAASERTLDGRLLEKRTAPHGQFQRLPDRGFSGRPEYRFHARFLARSIQIFRWREHLAKHSLPRLLERSQQPRSELTDPGLRSRG